MHVVPVLDLRHGQVVHGVAGQRHQYRPIASVLVDSAEPADVARALLPLATHRELYVADLDAIVEGRPQWAACRAVAANGAQLWLDVGIRSAPHLAHLMAAAEQHELDHRTSVRWIVGLESLESPAELEPLARRLGAERAIFSLDMRGGRVLAQRAADWPASPVELAARVVAAGFRDIILLDLAQVGSEAGVPIAPLVRELASSHAAARWSAGGGVRGLEDLVQLATAGCHAALVATALHRGQFSPAALAQFS